MSAELALLPGFRQQVYCNKSLRDSEKHDPATRSGSVSSSCTTLPKTKSALQARAHHLLRLADRQVKAKPWRASARAPSTLTHNDTLEK